MIEEIGSYLSGFAAGRAGHPMSAPFGVVVRSWLAGYLDGRKVRELERMRRQAHI